MKENPKNRVISFRISAETEEMVYEILAKRRIKPSVLMQEALEAYIANPIALAGPIQKVPTSVRNPLRPDRRRATLDS